MTEHDMPEKLRGWYISIIQDLTRREIVNLYNLLGNKMYEHRAEANTAITQLRTQYELAQKAVRELRGKADVAAPNLTQWLVKIILQRYASGKRCPEVPGLGNIR